MHTGQFTQKRGPLFANLVLADEINRAPAKVQSALLEAMQERQVTIGDTTHPLPDPFLVLATQNPIEQEGTFPLPEAQLDRFMLLIKVGYPTAADERAMLDRMSGARRAGAARGRDDRAGPRGAPGRRLDLHRRPRPRLHRPPRPGDARAARLRPRRARAADRVRRARRARRCASRPRRARTRSSATAPTSRPTTSRRSRSTCCATASSSPTRPRPRRSAPRTSCAASSSTCRCPSDGADHRGAVQEGAARSRSRRAGSSTSSSPVSTTRCSRAAAWCSPTCARTTPGDDVRTIDWNITARMNAPHVKQFVEERDRTVNLVIDMSASGYFGSRGATKRELAAELAAVVAFSAIKNNDRVGLFIVTDKVERFVPPKKGRRHVLRVIGEILAFEPAVARHRPRDGPRLPRQGRAAAHRSCSWSPTSSSRGLGARAADRARSATSSCRSSSAIRWRRRCRRSACSCSRTSRPAQVVEVDTSGARARATSRGGRAQAAVPREQALRRLNLDVVEVRTDRAVRRRADRVLQGAREADGARMSARAARAGDGGRPRLAQRGAALGAGDRIAARAAGAGSAAAVGLGLGLGLGLGQLGSGSVIQLPTDVGAPEVSAAASPTVVKLGGRFTLFVTATLRRRASRSTCASRSSSARRSRSRRKLSRGQAARATARTTREWQLEVIAWELGDLQRPAGRRDVHGARPGRPGRRPTRCRSRSSACSATLVDDRSRCAAHAPPTGLTARDWFWIWIATAAGAAVARACIGALWLRRRRRRRALRLVGGAVARAAPAST